MKKYPLLLFLLPTVVFCQEFKAELDSIILKKFNKGSAVSVLISRNFEPTYSLISGNVDLENNIKANELSKFRIGSVTKQFTAIAILKLMEEGKLSLKDPIQKYLPYFPIKAHPIQIEHLLTHTSGLVEITELDVFFDELMKKGCNPDTLVNYFKDAPLQFIPGTEFRYNNSGYHLLGLIIERTSGIKYDEYVQKNLLSIAGMNNSVAGYGMPIINNRASGYEEENGALVNATYIDMSIPFSAGNLLSTANDLNLWYKALFGYQLVSEKTLNTAHSPFQLNDGSLSKYGYGWFVDSLQGEKLISHEGGINGFLSSAWYIPSKKALAVVLSNCMCSPTFKTAKMATAFAIDKPLTTKTKLKISPKALQKFVGSYKMDGEVWTISLMNHELYFKFANGKGHAIYPSSENEFFAEDWDTKFVFEESKNTIRFHFIYLNEQIVGERIVED